MDRRSVLFIGISYYDYSSRISDSLESKGYLVKYYPNENRGFWMKTLKKFLPTYYLKILDKYHKNIIKNESNKKYDYIFFIQVHQFTLNNLKKLKKSQPEAKFILYNWDSLTTHNYTPYLPYFNEVHTFDVVDALKNNINYLPLFSLPEYFEIKKKQVPKYDLYFVGNIVTIKRMKAIHALDEFCKKERLKFKKHLQCSPAMMIRFLIKGLFIRGMTLRSISSKHIINIMEDSNGVFDYPNHQQQGYTFRLIENMCAGMKIVTSNFNIIEEKFYSTENFLLINDFSFSKLKDFLISKPKIQISFYEFSLNNWVDKIFK